MLVLTRRENESILIGDNITITILGVRGSRIQVGVEAPKAVRVLRQEVQARLEAGEPPRVPAPAFGPATVAAL